ncbi:S8 family serine peptidase [Joostella sp. CR20]|uniref:S8 family serine peptidase n=1 Tax=Joostella sp. CR20 TaxID=2804312 RepID=UPI00313ACA45
MKKNYFLCFCLLTVFFASAQQKPGKWENINAIKAELHEQQVERAQSLEILKRYALPYATRSTKLKNGKAVQIVEADTLNDGTSIYFKGVEPNGAPTYYRTYNFGGAKTIGVDKVKSGGEKVAYTGKNMLIGEWDGGTQTLHYDIKDRLIPNDPEAGYSQHATHVAGTIIGDGKISKTLGFIENVEGMAPDAKLTTYYWDNDALEMIEEVEKNNLLVSNHSYGYIAGVADVGLGKPYFLGYDEDNEDYHFGYYSETDALRDAIVYNYPDYLPVWAAGNEGTQAGLPAGTEHYVWNGTELVISTKERVSPCGDGYDCIPYGNIGKNILTVGAIAKNSYGAAADTYKVTAFSSKGPTDDGRIKPDVVAPGESIMSTQHLDDYKALNGTSMATPMVTGSIALIQESAKKELRKTLKASTIKALIINTANEAGNIGPDYHFGWGVVDTYKAVKAVETNRKQTLIEETTLNNGGTKTFYVQASGNEPLKLTMAWTDVPGAYAEVPKLNDRTKMLVNDLDIKIYDEENNEYLPWVLDFEKPNLPATKGNNDIDNVEQIVIDTPKKNGRYKVVVSHKGELYYGGQNFSLVYSGLKGKEKTDVGIKSVERKNNNRSFNNPGVFLNLEGSEALEKVAVTYKLINQNGAVVFQNTKRIDFIPSEKEEFFLKFAKKDGSPVLASEEYKLEVEISHSEDKEERNNEYVGRYLYYVESVLTPEDIYTQSFDGLNTQYFNQGAKLSSQLSFGWNGVGDAFYTRTSRGAGSFKGLAIYLASLESGIQTVPFVLKEAETYTLNYWLQSGTKDVLLPESFTVVVRNAVNDKDKETITLQATETTDGKWTLYQASYTHTDIPFVKFELQNALDNIVVVDDFTIAFKDSEALIVEVEYYYHNDLVGEYVIEEEVTTSTFNTYVPLVYNANYVEVAPEELDAFSYEWKVTGMGYEFVKETDKNTQRPKIRVTEDRGEVGINVTVNGKYSSGIKANILVKPPRVEYIFNHMLDYIGGRWLLYGSHSSVERTEIQKITGFKNNYFGVSANTMISYPQQTRPRADDGLMYKTDFYTENDASVDIIAENTYAERRIYKEPGVYHYMANTIDVATQGKAFNQTDTLVIHTIKDQFQPINSLVFADQKKEDKKSNSYTLQWNNPELYYMETMTFDANTENLIEIAQFEGQSKLNWRVHNVTPILAVNGTYSMVSESIDEETMVHEDIDNWFYLKNANKAKFKYFSFMASMGVDYPEDEYEVYLLDKNLASNPDAPTINDFLSNGVLVATEALSELDEEIPHVNYTVEKVVDLEAVQLKNKEVYIAFRHNTRASKKGSFLSIDLLRFHNVLDSEIGISLVDLNVYASFDIAGKADLGWYGLNPHVYPIKGYEIAQYNTDGERKVLQFIEDANIDSLVIDKADLDEDASELGVTLQYDLSNKNLEAKYNQHLDTPEFEELTVAIPSEEEPEVLNPFDKENSVFIYPVPINYGKFKAKVDGPFVGDVTYSVYSVYGAEVASGTFRKSSEGAHVESINVSQIKYGIYIVKFKVGKEIFIRKFIKLNK